MFTKTGSEIINFYKFKNNKYKFNPTINDTEKEKWSINFCNDTVYTKFDGDREKILYNSSIVYTDKEKRINYVFTGGFFRRKSDE